MKITLSIMLSLIAVLGLPAVAHDNDDKGGRSDHKSLHIRTELSGAQQVPAAAATDTTGSIRLQFDKGLSRADFALRVKDGIGVTQAHIHCGRAGANGPAIVFLFGFVPGGVNVDGKLARGRLTNDDFLGSDCASVVGVPVNNIASLALAARAGLLYVNVHTVAYPAGEVRGQLFD